MASSTPTKCPGCGGPASFHADDGITYCEDDGPNGCAARAENKKCVGMHIEDLNYQPPSYRGGKK